MTLVRNELWEFIDDYDPFHDDGRRASVYASCRVEMSSEEFQAVECDECHRLFKPRARNQAYCSTECRDAASKRRRIKRRGL